MTYWRSAASEEHSSVTSSKISKASKLPQSDKMPAINKTIEEKKKRVFLCWQGCTTTNKHGLFYAIRHC